MRYAYKFRPAEIIRAFRKLLGLSNIYAESLAEIAVTLNWHESGMDFADALHLATCQDCDAFYTFDEQLVKKGNEFSACPVKIP